MENDDAPSNASRSSIRLSATPADVQTKVNVTAPSALFSEHSAVTSQNRDSRVFNRPNKQQEEVKIIRRTIAEDPTYNAPKVAPLSDLCLKHFVDNFAYNSNPVNYLNPKQKRTVLDSLEPDLPLKVTAPVIGEDHYWARCCKKGWGTIDLARHGGSWKRAFFERLVEETIETFIPGYTYAPRLSECVHHAAPYVQRLDIKQLLPPFIKQGRRASAAEESDYSDSEDESNSQQFDHLDLGPVISKLPNLQELSICYTVKNCGIDFNWSVFMFTRHDCTNLSAALQAHKGLRKLHLTKSRLDSELCQILCTHIINHPNLEHLDLSHNFIGNRGARALKNVLESTNCLKTLDLCDNRIHSAGGLALAHALCHDSCELVRLNLRLNRLQQEGATAIAKSLLTNITLKELNLAANDISESAAEPLSQVLARNHILTHLDLSNNQMGLNASRALLVGMQNNTNLIYFDLRFTGICQETEYQISQLVDKNQDRQRQMTLKNLNLEGIKANITNLNLSVGITTVGS